MLHLAGAAGSRREVYHHHHDDSHSALDDLHSDIPEPYTYRDEKRNVCCLSGFRELYENEQLFDITLKVDGKDFQGHRSLLAASSDYFKAMFTTSLAEKDKKEIVINGVDHISMEQIMNYLYSGEAKMLSHTVQNLLSAANLFQLQDLRDGCANFMARKLDVENCIGVHFFAQLHECENLEFQAWDMITENFDAVSSVHEFLNLSPENLIEIIKYDDLQANEDEVFEAAMRWLQHAPDERSEFIYNVFVHIRLALIDEHYFYDDVKSNIHLQRVPQLEGIFDEVIRYKLLKSRWMESDLRLEPRYGADFCRVVVYTSYMDDEKKQVLQLYGQRSDEATTRNANILCDIPADIENPSILVTGDNELYIAGGDGHGKCLFKWCYEDTTFEEMAPMTVNRKQFSLVQVDKSIYAVGGCNSEDGNLTSVSRYLEGDDDWEDAADLPKALRCMTCVAFHGKLYLFGGECERINKKVGRGKKELNKQTLCYDPREDKWNVLADMPTARALAGCTVFRNKIYVIGGFGTVTESWLKDKSPENCLTTVEIYDPETNSWEEGPELLVPLCAMGVVKYYGTIYVMGGENDEDVSNNVYYLNTEENKWEHKDEMVTGMTETTIHSSYAVINIDMESQ